MKLNWKYIAFIVILFAVFFVFQASLPRYFNWTITFYHLDKNPYGGKVFYDLLLERFEEVEHNFATVYETSGAVEENIIILAESYRPDEYDMEALLTEVGSGKTALIAAEDFTSHFTDTLNLEVKFPFAEFTLSDPARIIEDSVKIRLVNEHFLPRTRYRFPKQIGQFGFSRIDTLSARIIAVNDGNDPVLVSYPFGEGELLICSTPLVFTNYGLLLDDNYQLVEKILSYFGSGPVQWFQYYQMGRMESTSPLRYVLNDLPLKWAFYVTLLTLFLFMIFEAKRKQRIIPVIEPLRNHTLAFTRVIGRLYYQKRDHKDLAWKKIIYFHEYMLNHYFIDIFREDENLDEQLARKAGKEPEEAKKILDMIRQVKSAGSISSRFLFQLNKLVDKFYLSDSK